jgi:hypothetical protein
MPTATASDDEIDMLFAHILRKSLAGARFPLHDEKACQVAIADMLDANGVTYDREKRMDGGNIPDFWIPDGQGQERGAVLEVKMSRHTSATQIVRQLIRYAKLSKVRSIFLVSNRAVPLPVSLEGKPAFFISLGEAWL